MTALPESSRTERLHARLSVLSRSARSFALDPEPRSIGAATRGAQIVAGHFLFHGYLVEASDTSLWDLPLPDDPAFRAELHAMGWLDDLAAQGTRRAEALAREWVDDWARHYGGGTGPGWSAALTGRRVAGWIAHGQILSDQADPSARARFFRTLSRQVAFLRRVVGGMEVGVARLEVLQALHLAALYLEDRPADRRRAIDFLIRDIAILVDKEGGIASRNPEDLARVFRGLADMAATIRDTGDPLPPAIADALALIAPVLRSLRHGDGALARFHGGGRGIPGQLDVALAQSGLRAGAPPDRAMGFARLSHARTTLIIDAASPPEGAGSSEAHASTLAFELTSGRRPIVVNCGAGGSFGAKWRRAGRATPSHSTLALDGFSSARLGAGDDGLLSDAPRDVRIEQRRNDLATGLIAGHDGYVQTHGLTHVRQLYLDNDGRKLHGEDVLATVERSDETIFDRAMADANQQGIPFRIRFHLHPDITVQAGVDDHTILLMTRGGELWSFQDHGAAALSLEPSVYLDAVSLSPRPTRQIVLSSTAVDYATRVSWTLAKARQTPDAVRDTVHDDTAVLA